MKVNEMTLQQCVDAVRIAHQLDSLLKKQIELGDILRQLSERIDDLTRWIPVEEQMPTESDIGLGGRFWVYINGLVTDACFAGGIIHVWDDESFNSGWSEYNKNDYRTAFTHWKRIDKPEVT